MLSLEIKLKIENLGRPIPILDIKQLVVCKSGQYIEFPNAKFAIICYVSILSATTILVYPEPPLMETSTQFIQTSIEDRQGDPGGPVVIILVTGSEVRRFKPSWGRWIFSEHKNPEYDFLRKESKAVGLLHVKEPQAEIRASEQNLLDFSRSL